MVNFELGNDIEKDFNLNCCECGIKEGKSMIHPLLHPPSTPPFYTPSPPPFSTPLLHPPSTPPFYTPFSSPLSTPPLHPPSPFLLAGMLADSVFG